MSVATLGAFAVGAWEEAAGVMIFYMIGELIQEAAVNRSRSSINALLALKPDKARIQQEGVWTEVSAGEVSPGALVLVRPGERIPLDGIVSEGTGSIDASMLTGESKPVVCTVGDEVRSGTVSVDGVLQIETTRTAGESSAARIIKLVEGARDAKARPERFISSFARWYTPLVVAGAALLALLPPLFIPGARFTDWVYRALILLVISCPCALVVSVPLGYFAGIGGMSRRGIMVKGAVHLDSLHRVQNVAFDKTGTLTQGKFSIQALEPAGETSGETLLEAAFLAEQESNHPIAQAINRYALDQGLVPGASGAGEVTGRREIAGRGLELTLSNGTILTGTLALLEARHIPVPPGMDPVTATGVYVARDGRYLGRILIGDRIKESAPEAIRELQTLGIKNTVIITGDNRAAAGEVAARLGISKVESELLPEDKLDSVERLSAAGVTVFVGDGINDAPVLARSNVGIAMGSGSDVAVEAADVIIMTDDLRRVPEAISRARRTRRIIMENVALALGTKGIFIVLAGLGMANMWLALIADVGVCLAAVVNSTRTLR
jgi:Cd2+/Zn2+-exporting ATPase